MKPKSTPPTHPALWTLETDGSIAINGQICLTAASTKADTDSLAIGRANCRMIVEAVHQYQVRKCWPLTSIERISGSTETRLHLRGHAGAVLICAGSDEPRAWATAAAWAKFLEETGRIPESNTIPTEQEVAEEVRALDAVLRRVPNRGKHGENNHGAIIAQKRVLNHSFSLADIQTKFGADEYVRDCAIDAYLWMTGNAVDSTPLSEDWSYCIRPTVPTVR